MMNTRFASKDEEKIEKMTRLWAQLFAVMMKVDKPLLQSIVYLNDNFEEIYMSANEEKEVYEYIFDEVGIIYKYI